MIILLKTLPSDHVLRNTPMNQLKAEHRLISGNMWKTFDSWAIGKCTYNQVEKFWSTYYEFRANFDDTLKSTP